MSTVQGPLVDGSLGDVCVAANVALVAMVPLMAQFDALLFGSFGIGSIQADLSAQFNAALAAQLQLGLQISDPFAAFKAALVGLLQVQAGLEAALALGLPSVSVEIGAQFNAALALAAALRLKLGGIDLLIKASLQLKIPVVKAIGKLDAALSVGSFGLWYMEGPCSVVAEDLRTTFVNGVPLNSPIAPTDTVYGVVLLSKAPAAKGSLNLFFGLALLVTVSRKVESR